MGADDGKAARQRYNEAKAHCLRGLLAKAHKELKQVPTGLTGTERTEYTKAREALKVLVKLGF